MTLGRKFILVSVLTVLLMIPLAMVFMVVSDRQNNYRTAQQSVMQSWANEQALAGPVLVVPVRATPDRDNPGGKKEEAPKARMLFIAPTQLSVVARLVPEIRHRSLYAIPVYRADVAMTARFDTVDVRNYGFEVAALDWSRAWLSFAVSDARGLSGGEPDVRVNGTRLAPESGTGRADGEKIGGFSVYPAVTGPKGAALVTARFALKGTRSLAIAPMGRQTDVALSSSWKSPRFAGEYLPDTQSATAKGFHAEWSISHLARQIPQAWTDREGFVPNWLPRASSGALDPGEGVQVALEIPLDLYDQNLRAAKYGVLIIALTLLAYFLIDAGAGLNIHAVEYLLVGLALCLFFVLTLALSEYLSFGPAYLAAATATVLLISTYSAAVLRSVRRAGLIAGVLALLYGFIYILLTLEEAALLVGALALFAILAATMFAASRINWRSEKGALV